MACDSLEMLNCHGASTGNRNENSDMANANPARWYAALPQGTELQTFHDPVQEIYPNFV
jgi:hypothetical protein